MINRVQFLLAILLVLVTAACGAGNQAPTPTLPPEPTVTPISTALPDVPTSVPAGLDAENPLQLVIVPADPEGAAALLQDFQNLLADLTGLNITVVLAQSQAEAASLLCASNRGAVSAVWVSGMTGAIAAGMGCGVPSLQLNRGTAEDVDTGSAGVLLIHAELASVGVEAIPGRPFCRTSYTDFFSWTVPLLMLRSEGIDVTQIEDIDEFDTAEDLIRELASGDCAAAGMSVQDWEALLAEDETLSESVTVVGQSVEFPYAMLLFPFSAPLEVVNPVVGALLELDYTYGRAEEPVVEVTPDAESTQNAEATEEATEESSDVVTDADTEVNAEATAEATEDARVNILLAFFGDGIFQTVSPSDFANLTDFLAETGVSFEELSN
jgi:hypothetical protein